MRSKVMDEANGTRLDLICDCGKEYEAALMDSQEFVEVVCPKCGKKNIITKDDIESALDAGEDSAVQKLNDLFDKFT